MPRGQRGSIRLWQTAMFVAVIVVAILILAGSLSAGLKATLTQMSETSESRNASALAERLAASLPLGVDGTADVRRLIAEYRDIYGGGIWVYDAEGTLLESAFDTAPTDAVLESALLWGLDQNEPHVTSNLSTGGWIVASHPIRSASGTSEGVVITASSADAPARILHSVRDRLWIAFWASLVTAGALGFTFSEVMRRRISAMSDAAAAVAAGDFDQRMSAGIAPDEIHDLADSYNRMAVTLGATFGDLEESRRQIAAVVESMAEGLAAFDPSGTVRFVNPEAARLLGTSADEAPGHVLEDLVEESRLVAAVRAGLAGERASDTVILGSAAVLAHCTPILQPNLEVGGAVLLLSDVTDRQRIEASQRRFVADASHEMRTPIAALKGILELLEDGAKNVPEVRDDFIHTMQVEADRLSRLVTDLLTLASLDAGSLKLEPTPQHARDLLGNVSSVMRTLAEQDGVRLVAEVADEDLEVMADRDRIVQVLLSFTDNALKHSASGGSVALRAFSAGERVRFEVSDEGAGIDAEDLDRVFERFYRADSARGGTGTGLGLAIAREIVEAHGSEIEVRSEPGEGTTFAFELPQAR
ncbi:MAG: HAMP domain-containing protein [Actinobacteria bacterium]|nr:HAMP domain-containing protein [Actinomycetota bacterium]